MSFSKHLNEQLRKYEKKSDFQSKRPNVEDNIVINNDKSLGGEL